MNGKNKMDEEKLTEMERFQLRRDHQDTPLGKQLNRKRSELPGAVRREIARECEDSLRAQLGDEEFDALRKADPFFMYHS